VCLVAVVTKILGLPIRFIMVSADSVRKNRCRNCCVSWPVLYYILAFLTCPIKIISPNYLLLSSCVILDYFSVLGDNFPLLFVSTVVKIRLFSK
jgi:hypothetical protein